MRRRRDAKRQIGANAWSRIARWAFPWGIAALVVALPVSQPPVYAQEGEAPVSQEKPPITLPEVVVVGNDLSVFRTGDEKEVPEPIALGLKERPPEAKEKIDPSSLPLGPKTAPDVERPSGCFGNPVTGAISRAFLADEGQYKTGIFRFQEGDFPGAKEAFEQLLADYPKSTYRGATFYWLGEIAFDQNDRSAALTAYDTVITKHSMNSFRAWSSYSAAWILIGRGKYAEAQRLLEELLETAPQNPIAGSVHFLLGKTLFAQRQFRQASDHYAGALEMEPGGRFAERALLWLAESHYQLASFEEAYTHYRDYRQRYPQGKFLNEALYGLGWSAEKTRRSAEARRVFNEVLKRLEAGSNSAAGAQFGDSAMYGKIRALLSMERSEEAEEEYRLLRQRYANSRWVADGGIQVAIHYFDQRRYAEAWSFFSQVLEGYPGTYLALLAAYLGGESLYRLSDYTKVVVHFQRLAQLFADPTFAPGARFRLALAYYRLERYGHAAEQFRRFLKRFSASQFAEEARFMLGEVLYRERRYAEATAAFAAIPAGSERYIEARYGLAWSLYRQDEWRRAARQFLWYAGEIDAPDKRADALFRAADGLVNAREFDFGTRLYLEIMSRYATLPIGEQAQFQLAWTHYRRSNYAIAARHFQALREAGGELAAQSAYWYGMTFFSQGDYPQARREFFSVWQRFSVAAVAVTALLRMGDAYYNEAKYANAITTYENVIAEYRRSALVADAHYGIVQSYYQLGDFGRFLDRGMHFVRTFRDNPRSVILQFQLAGHLVSAEAYVDAALAYHDIVRREPQSELADDAQYRLAEVEVQLANPAAALEAFNDLLERFPNSSMRQDARLGKARVLMQMSLHQQAVGELEQLLANAPGGPMAPAGLLALGESFIAIERPEAARAVFERFVSEYPVSPARFRVYLEYGKLLQEASEREAALEALRLASESPEEALAAEAQFRVGEVQAEAGNHEQAAVELLKVAYLYPNLHTWRDRALLRSAEAYEKIKQWGKAGAVYRKLSKESDNPERVKQARKKLWLMRQRLKKRKR